MCYQDLKVLDPDTWTWSEVEVLMGAPCSGSCPFLLFTGWAGGGCGGGRGVARNGTERCGGPATA
jgi:hypothetical protein